MLPPHSKTRVDEASAAMPTQGGSEQKPNCTLSSGDLCGAVARVPVQAEVPLLKLAGALCLSVPSPPGEGVWS